MRTSVGFSIAALASQATLLDQTCRPRFESVNLYVASYSGGSWAGNVTTLSLVQQPFGSYSLKQISTLNTSTNSPSWLTLDRQNNLLYMVDEAVNVSTGTLVSYKTSYSGELTEVKRQSALPGGVHAAFFASGRGLAIPKYATSTLQTYKVTPDGEFSLLQTFDFTNPFFNFTIGPVAERQEAPHPHGAILDPTQRYLLVPDLGADQVHVFAVDQATAKLTPLDSLVTAPGYGPRHGAFSLTPINGNYIFYLVGELSGNVAAYRVSYAEGYGGMSFTELATYTTLNSTVEQSKTAPAEIAISPDGHTVLVSNRNDATFGTNPENDSLASYKISLTDGTLMKQPLVPAYGAFPRQFALNKAGTLLAVGLQNSGNLVVLKRNVTSGLFDEEVANINFAIGANFPVCVVWDE